MYRTVEVLGPTMDYQSPQTNAYVIYEPGPRVVKKLGQERRKILLEVFQSKDKIRNASFGESV